MIEEVFREERGRILASLIRFSGSFDLAEDALQEAFASAVESWPSGGMPANPGAWLTAAARRKVIDAVRRERIRQQKTPEPGGTEQETEMPYADDRLPLLFTCCHPALNREAQVGLTLRTLGGLTSAEIARAFLIPEPSLAQRLVRAKKKIRAARIPYQVPPPDRLQERLEAVQAVIYLIFNEGYTSIVRSDLSGEAIRLGRVLCELMPEERENRGLLALMLLQDSRRAARMDSEGRLVTLEDQDRALWDRGRIREAFPFLGGDGPYQMQAQIAAEHTRETTNWETIAGLYSRLYERQPSPVIALNRAVAVAMWEGCEAGLLLMDKIDGLEEYYLLHAARADLLRRLGRWDEAVMAYERALALTSGEVERVYIASRIKACRFEAQ